jgi:formylglycine-generating enzyme required for sulfatase activity
MALQSLALPAPPQLAERRAAVVGADAPVGDVALPGGEFDFGAAAPGPVVFDNEQWAHAVSVAPFAIAQRCVTGAEFTASVADRGYARRGCGRTRDAHGSTARVARRQRTGGVLASWQVRCFDGWHELDAGAPVQHVSWLSRRLLPLGGATFAHRSRMGICRAFRPARGQR